MKSSATASWTRIRWIEMQLWPAWEKAWIWALSAAVSQSPSSLTISGALEPSSRLTFLCGTLAADVPADRGRAGEGDRLGQRVLDDRVADLRAGAGDDAEPALGQARLDQDLGQLQGRDRRLPGGLEDDRVAGGDRRAELVGDEVEREVEGADRADHPVGDAQHHAELAGAGRRRRPSAPCRRSACAPRRRRTRAWRRSVRPRPWRS